MASRLIERPITALLHDAAERGDCAQLDHLIANGAEIDAGDYDGTRALHAAAEGGQARAMRILLRAHTPCRTGHPHPVPTSPH